MELWACISGLVTTHLGETMYKRDSQSSAPDSRRLAVLYARVSSKEQEKEGYSIPAQLKLLRDHASVHGLKVVREFTDVETAKKAGRKAFGEMVGSVTRLAGTVTSLLPKALAHHGSVSTPSRRNSS